MGYMSPKGAWKWVLRSGSRGAQQRFGPFGCPSGFLAGELAETPGPFLSDGNDHET